jgi:hypothetical protein
MATTTTASSVTGQGALLGLPSKSQLSRRSIGSYSLPENLIQDKDSLMQEEGLPVYKVTKVCQVASHFDRCCCRCHPCGPLQLCREFRGYAAIVHEYF